MASDFASAAFAVASRLLASSKACRSLDTVGSIPFWRRDRASVAFRAVDVELVGGGVDTKFCCWVTEFESCWGDCRWVPLELAVLVLSRSRLSWCGLFCGCTAPFLVAFVPASGEAIVDVAGDLTADLVAALDEVFIPDDVPDSIELPLGPDCLFEPNRLELGDGIRLEYWA